MKNSPSDADFDFLPDEWREDEAAMNHRFQPFLKTRDANPVGYDAKIKFWQQLVLKYCEKQKKFLVSANSLKEAFSRKGEKPQCLHVVLESMYASGSLQKLGEYDSGLFGKFWNIGSWVVRSTFGYLKGYRTVNPSIAEQQAEVQQRSAVMYVHSPTLKSCKHSLLTKLKQVQMQKMPNSIIVDLAQFNAVLTEVTDGCDVSKTLLINELKTEGKIHEFSVSLQVSSTVAPAETTGKNYSQSTGQRTYQFIKVADAGASRTTPVDENELIRIRNLLLQEVLSEEIVALEKRVAELNAKALSRKSSGDLKGALACIAQRRRVDAAIEQKNAQRTNLHEVLTQLDEAELNKSVLTVLETSNAAFRKLRTDQSLNVDTVTDIMDQTADAVRESQEIGTLLSNSVSNETDAALTDFSQLEAELDEILLESSSPETSRSAAESTPKADRSRIDTALPSRPQVSNEVTTDKSKQRKLVAE